MEKRDDNDFDFHHNDAIKLIRECIKKLELNLEGYTVLTEAGSNYYIYMPIIAALAKADKVFAWTADTNYGLGSEIKKECLNLAEKINITDKIEIVVNKKPISQINQADIITNSGFLRPLDADFLSHLKDNAVIPLMFEKWEVREHDIDINYCKKNGIKVAGTWENHPSLKIFDYCGSLAVKMAIEAGYEVFQNKIIVWSDDNFGDVIEKAFIHFGAAQVIKTIDKKILYKNVVETDFIFFCDYDEHRQILGEGGFINMEEIIAMNDAIGIVHLYGKINNQVVRNYGLNIYPDKEGFSSVMAFTLSHVGMVPIINLHAAGLKVGECLIKNIDNELVQKIT